MFGTRAHLAGRFLPVPQAARTVETTTAGPLPAATASSRALKAATTATRLPATDVLLPAPWNPASPARVRRARALPPVATASSRDRKPATTATRTAMLLIPPVAATAELGAVVTASKTRARDVTTGMITTTIPVSAPAFRTLVEVEVEVAVFLLPTPRT